MAVLEALVSIGLLVLILGAYWVGYRFGHWRGSAGHKK